MAHPTIYSYTPGWASGEFSETHLFPKLQMGLRHRPLLLSCVHAQLCLTLCDPMDCSLPGSFCPWDAQIPQINVVGCGGVESLPTSAHTQGIQWVGVRCFTPSLALGRLFFLARGPWLREVGEGMFVCVCVCHEFFRSGHLQWPVELHMGKKYPLTV